MNEDLARRAVACKHWRWLPGMLADSDCYGSWRLYQSGPHLSACGERGGYAAAWDAIADGEGIDAYPALDDPATLGCLLALVAEAHGVTLLDVHVVGTATGSASVWCVRLGESSDRLSDGPSKLAALVAALEAAP